MNKTVSILRIVVGAFVAWLIVDMGFTYLSYLLISLGLNIFRSVNLVFALALFIAANVVWYVFFFLLMLLILPKDNHMEKGAHICAYVFGITGLAILISIAKANGIIWVCIPAGLVFIYRSFLLATKKMD